MKLRELLIVAFLSACAGAANPPPPPPQPATAVEPAQPTDPTPATPAADPTQPTQQTSPSSPAAGSVADGGACWSATDCTSGVCEGEGCGQDTPGKCAPRSRACTRDLRAYCGCDGVTFQTSGSCPGKRFASRGACSGSAP